MRKGTLVIIILTVILAPIVVGVIVWEIQSQPLIDYTLGTPSSFDTRFNSYFQVSLMVRNRGKIDATVWLVLATENATIQELSGSNVEYNETKVRIRVFAQNSMEDWGTGQTLNVMPLNSTQTFSISYEVAKEFDWMSMFYRINPIIPTTLTFNQTQPYVYARLP